MLGDGDEAVVAVLLHEFECVVIFPACVLLGQGFHLIPHGSPAVNFIGGVFDV